MFFLRPSPPAGYYGSNCTAACALNPCEHEASCARKPGSSRGYSCHCPSNYFGEYCEKKLSAAFLTALDRLLAPEGLFVFLLSSLLSL